MTTREMAAERENSGSCQPHTCPMDMVAAQTKAEWELGMSPLFTNFFSDPDCV